MKSLQFLIFSLLFVIILGESYAKDLIKVAVVDMNRALNESQKGMQIKNSLESKIRSRREELSLKGQDLRKEIAELRNNLLLTPEARQQKEQELLKREQEFRRETQQIEANLRQEERRLTQAVFTELKPTIRAISLKDKYDFVLEKNAAQIILFSRYDFEDITQKVIDHYNALQNPVTNSKKSSN